MGKKSPEPEKPNVGQQAQDITAARLATDPQLAQSAFNILANPQYGAGPTTQLLENIRQQVFPNQSQVSTQMSQNVLGQLQSPTGITPEQQQAINARREMAQGELVRALRNRSNLGGGLYGGISMDEEGRQVGNLQNQFAEEDINREMMARQQAIQNSIPIMQMLYGQQIQSPQFQSATMSPDSYASSMNQYQNQLAQQQGNNSQLYSALLGGLGTAAGGFFGGPAGAMAGSKLSYLAPGGYTPNTPTGVQNMGSWSKF